ncbi:MAG TPA: tyrosine-type recombinase/integrase [Acidimicrobiia bacterium]|jgi:integrase
MSRRGQVWQEGRPKDAPAVRGAPWYFVVDIAPAGAPRKQVRRRGFPTKEAAQHALDELLGNVRDGTHVEPSRLSFGDYLRTWLDGLASKGRRPTTVDGYRRKLERYALKDDVAGIPLQAVTAADLDAVYGKLRTSGGRKGTALSLRTVRHVHTILAKALADAERKGLIARNPSQRAEPPTSTAARSPEAKTWTPDQLRAFLAKTSEHDHTTLFRLAAMTGMRRGELCGLRWSDVDLDAASLRVRQTMAAVRGELVEGVPKTERSARTIDLDPVTVAALKKHRTGQLEQRLLMGAGYADRDLVFAKPDGGPWNPDAVGRSFTREVERTKLPRIRFHDLRHSHATHLLAAGVNMRLVSERLGHATVGFTLDVYAHALPGQQADAAAAVAALVDA